jgi:hypothetical protein
MSSSDCLRLSRWTVSMRSNNSPASKTGSGLVNGLAVRAGGLRNRREDGAPGFRCGPPVPTRGYDSSNVGHWMGERK